MTSHHLYVHVPFCRLVCAYCDFVTVGGRHGDIPRYVDALLAELALRPSPGALETVYFGGGTPSLLPAEAVRRVLQAALDRWHRQPGEVTVEANPSARERPDWAALGDAGVSRISLGVQSFDDRDLATLARGHTAAEAMDAYREIRAAGFTNVSMDLIYGIPGQTADGWGAVLDRAIELAPDHLSLYALSLALAPDEWAAPPRAGALRWRRRLAAAQDDDLAAEAYRIAEETLGAAGYEHYELSSWARPGFASRHNTAYWTRRPYTGIGAGAHTYDGERRSWNTRDLDEYLERVNRGEVPTAGAEALSAGTRAFEALALGLRRVEGIRRAAFAAEFGADPAARWPEAVDRSVTLGLLELTPQRLRLSRAGRLLANEVLVAFAP